MSVYTTVFAGSTPIGNGLTGGVGGLWGTPAALVMNGVIALGAEAIAAVAVLRGFVPRIGAGAGTAAGAGAGVGVTAGASAGASTGTAEAMPTAARLGVDAGAPTPE
jgi:hypothetical protein